MATFVMPNEVTALPAEQQEAIRQVLIKAGLLTASGERTNLTAEDIPEKQKAALRASLSAMGLEENIALFGINLKCIAARVAELDFG